MCLNCGCMRAHDDMGKPGINLTYEDVKRAADGLGPHHDWRRSLTSADQPPDTDRHHDDDDHEGAFRWPSSSSC